MLPFACVVCAMISMSHLEFRILSQIALAVALMLPAGLVIFSWQRRKGARTTLEIAPEPAPVSEAPPVEISEPAAGATEVATVNPADSPWAPPKETIVPKPYRLGGADLMMGMVLCSLMALAMFGSKAYELAHPKPETESGPALSAGVVLLNFVILQGMQIGIIWAWFHARQTSIAEVFGLRRYRFPYSLGVAAILIVPAAIISSLALALFMTWLKQIGWEVEEQDAVKMFSQAPDVKLQLALALGACIGAPLVEEFLFRGVIYKSLKELSNKWFALIFSSLLFGVIHMHLPSFPALCLLGFFFALAYEVTGTLVVPILMHSIFNSVQVCVAIYGSK